MNSLTFYFLICACLLCIHSEAQIFRALKSFKEIEVGLGPNLYNIHYDESPTDQVYIKPGITGTLNFNYQFKPKIDLSLRLFYDYKGYVNRFTTYYYDSSTTATLSGEVEAETFSTMIGIAPLIKLKIANQRIFIEAGPFLSYFIKGRVERTLLWNNTTSIIKMDEENKFSGGLSFSVGYNIPIGGSLELSPRIIENLNLVNNIHDTISLQLTLKFKKI